MDPNIEDSILFAKHNSSDLKDVLLALWLNKQIGYWNESFDRQYETYERELKRRGVENPYSI